MIDINKLKEFLKWAASSKHSGTFGAAGLFVYITYVLYSKGILNEPGGIAYGSAALMGFGLIAILNHIVDDKKDE